MLVNDGMFLDQTHELYDQLVPTDNRLRRLNELSDFAFVFDELKENYCLDNGRHATSPVLLFKYLILKIIYKLSDEDVIERTRYDLSFKYFLGLHPLDIELIHPATLTKFRRKRLKDSELLNQLISESIQIAKKHKLIDSNRIIIDSTHTNARYNQISPREALIEESRELRKTVYSFNEAYHDQFPAKPGTGILEDHLNYCEKLIEIIQTDANLLAIPVVSEKVHYLKEMIEDNLEHLQTSYDTDAKTGHKTADTNFFGYKTHLAINDERLVTAVIVSSGEKNDGKYLQGLVEQSVENGVYVDEVVGDGAYSESENLKYAKENDIRLIAKLSKSVVNGNGHKGHNRNEFFYNKDADRYVCPQGHMAIRKTKANVTKKGITYPNISYFFNIEHCKICPQRQGCYKEGAQSKSFTLAIKKDEFKEHMKFMQETSYKTSAKERYKIEAINAHLKQNYGYRIASSKGLYGMHVQAATTVFVMNLERIIKLMDQRKA